MQAVPCRRRTVCKKTKIISTTHGRLTHVTNSLAGVDALDQRNLLRSRFDSVGDAVKQLTSRSTGHSSPLRECPGRRFNRKVDLCFTTHPDAVDYSAIDRCAVLQCWLTTANHRFPFNQVPQWRFLKTGKILLGLVLIVSTTVTHGWPPADV